MWTAREKFAGSVRIFPLGQHKDQPPGAGRIPAMQSRIRVGGGELGRLHPTYDRYSANLVHEGVERRGKGASGCFLKERAIGAAD